MTDSHSPSMAESAPDVMSLTSLLAPFRPAIIEGLVLVSTPIGNLGDITLRGLKTLMLADIIACEDTRVTGKLLNAYGLNKDKKQKLISFHDHNTAARTPQLLKHLKSGESVALVSDAGTPLISDPGFGLVQACQHARIPVTSCPGPSSVVTALSLSGLASDQFVFLGFLPSKSADRKKALTEAAVLTQTMVMFESPKRLMKSLADIQTVLSSRPMAICRELTKRHEEILRGTPENLLTQLTAQKDAIKGEIVLVIEGANNADATALSDTDLDALILKLLPTHSVKDAAATIAAQHHLKKKEVYQRALALQNVTKDTANE